MDDNLIERLMLLWEGLERAHGEYHLGERKENGKFEGKAYTRRAPVTKELWEKHVAGEVGLGIVPINDDALVKWGVIDVDVYPLDIQALGQLPQEQWEALIFELPKHSILMSSDYPVVIF